MKLLHASIDIVAYRSQMVGENLGWTILAEPGLSFRPVHRIEYHVEDGPVIVLDHTVYEIDPASDPLFSTDEQAMDAYYKEKS